MTDHTLHEGLYRGPEAIATLARTPIAICGAGALGSLLADNLVRQGARRLAVIDDDRIEAHNAGTQLYGQADAGGGKVEVLRAALFRSTGVEIEIHRKRLDAGNAARLLRGAELVVDTFDNSASRRLVTEHCRGRGVHCLHLGMNADFGEVRWNERYRVPGDVVGPDVCEYPLARNLVLLAVAAGSEAILRHLLDDRRTDLTLTLRDLRISESG